MTIFYYIVAGSSESAAMRVVVIGGGIMGCATAYYLTQLGPSSLEVTLVEGHVVAGQASGKAGGFLAKDWCRGHLGHLAKKSFQLHAELASEFGAEAVGYRALDTVMAEVNESRSGRTNSSSSNVPKWMDCDVTSSSVGGTKETTAQVHPKLLTETLLQKAVDKGARVVMAWAQSVELDDEDKVRGVVLDNGESLPADVAVVAMGPWSHKANDWFPKARLPDIRGRRAHSVVLSADLTADAAFVSLSGGDDPELYPRPDGTVYVCGRGDAEDLPQRPDQVECDLDSCAYLSDVAAKVSSSLSGAAVLSRQACYLPSASTDGIPLIGAIPRYDGAFIAVGHTCWGILNGPATGKALAELILDGTSGCVDLTAFDPKRFAR